mgnify:CR=1 FL=1
MGLPEHRGDGAPWTPGKEAPSSAVEPKALDIRKAFIEVTTRCNLRCSMCVKSAYPGPEGDMDPDLYERILVQMPELSFLGLSGIGEPLLHPKIIDFVRLARKILPEAAVVGFNSNGILIDESMAEVLAASGLDKIALSIDSVDVSTYGSIRRGGTFDRALAAMDTLDARIRRTPGTRLRLGVQTVLMKENFRSLPRMARFFAEHGARFLILSHLLPYQVHMEKEVVYDANSEGAVRIFERFRDEFRARGVTYERYQKIMQKFLRTEEERQVVELVQRVMDQAAREHEYVNIPHLLQKDEALIREVEEIFAETREVSERYGLEIEFPNVVPSSERRCDFIEDRSVFVDFQGKVYPCYFLWHSYLAFVHGRRKHVMRREMGDLAQEDLASVWNREEFRLFRESAKRYDVPFCTDCNLASCCDYVLAEEFEQDCAGTRIPCGDCLWCKGIFKCLSS